MSRKLSIVLIIGLVAALILAHYASQTYLPQQIEWHNVFSKFLLIPILLAAYWWGLKGGLLLGGLSAWVSLVDIFQWGGPSHPEFYGKIAEMILFIGIGGLLGALVDRERRAQTGQLVAERRAKDAYRKSILDPLTQAFNRSFMEKMLQSYWEQAKDEGHSFSLLMLDLNDFKQINDIHGHGAGDRVLRSTVQTLCCQTRQTDFVCRVGGDEFIVILPNCHKDAAFNLAKRLRQEMAKLTFSNARAPFKADFSIGVLEYRSDIGSLNDLLTKLDEALSRAKHHESCISLAG